MEDVRLLILLQETDFFQANLRVKSKVKTGRVKTRGLSLQRCNSVLDSGTQTKENQKRSFFPRRKSISTKGERVYQPTSLPTK